MEFQQKTTKTNFNKKQSLVILKVRHHFPKQLNSCFRYHVVDDTVPFIRNIDIIFKTFIPDKVKNCYSILLFLKAFHEKNFNQKLYFSHFVFF